jgi:hypothetical protein
MTSSERFAAALQDLDDIVSSVEAESLWRHPFDRLRAVMYSDEAARLRSAFSRGDAAVRANLARAAENLANEARQAFTVVIDTTATPVATSTTVAPAQAPAPARPPSMEAAAIGAVIPQIVAGGLVAVGVVSGAMMISAAIRAIGGARGEAEYVEYDER